MVHTRHSFKESFSFRGKEREDGRRASRVSRKDVDYNVIVNGKSSKPHSQPSKKRKFNSSINEYMYNSRDAIPGKDHFTRNSSKARTSHYSGAVSVDESVSGVKDTSMKSLRKDDDLDNAVGSLSEPRRSSRQRREVYGTLNEKLLVWNKVKGSKSEDGKEDTDRSMYDFVKQRKRNDTEQDENDEEEGDEEDDSEDDDEEDDDDDDETEEQEEDQGSQERPYSFRERRPTTRRYCAPPIAVKSRRSEALYNAVPHSPMHKRRHRKMPQHGGSHKRKHYGSSTSSSSGDSDDEHRFERRKAKSMAKARARCLPMNFNPGDIFGVLKDRERAKERQPIGSSLADVDPMNIDKGVTFESVGGLDKHIQSLKEMIVFPLLYPEVFEKFKIAPPRGVLFYGPPGTGKTLVARALANECSSEGHKVAFFMRKGADCLSKWVGESERQLRLLFDQAYSMRPSIIFFDEIDGLAPVRSTRQDQIHSSIVSTLLALMDGLDSRGEVVVIGATNRIDSIDPALRRPGRFDREFLFTLPNRVARRSILEIHTREWQPKLSKNFVNELGDLCVGYCGADIKALCTEAALVALRRRYPQIYGTNKKLVLDIDNIRITLKDFQNAMGKVVPASQRSVVSPARSLERIMKPLLESTLESVLRKIRAFFPPANPVNDANSTCSSSKNQGMPLNLDVDTSDEDESDLPSIYEPLSYGRSTRATQRASSPQIENRNFVDIIERSQMRKMSHRARFLITGKEGMGQSTHLAPAILYSMEHLKVYVLDLPSLFGVSARVPEEACAQIFTEARRTAPCVIYLPHIETWWSSISDTCRATFLTLLDDFPASLPVILLSTSNCTFEELPSRVRDLFSPLYEEIFEVAEPTDNVRRLFFQDLLLKSAMEPIAHQRTSKPRRPLEILPVAAPPPKRQLSDQELKNLREMEENTLRELRLFLRQIAWKLMADRKFKEFMKPVDLEEVPDYYEVIKEPMNLSTIMTKINAHKYVSCAQFLKDVDLITNNCLEYNPDRDTYDRLLRNRACELRDTAHAMICADLDPEFEKMCEEIHESRQKRNESEEIFAPSYIRVLQKNALPLRATSAASSGKLTGSEGCDQPKTSADAIQSAKDPKKRHDNITPEKPTRQSRRLRGEESVDIPSFSTPIEKIIRSPDGRRRRGRKSDSSKSHDELDSSDAKPADDESKIEGFEENCIDTGKIDGVEKLDESMEAEEGTVKEEKDASHICTPDEEKGPKEESFVILKRVEDANSDEKERLPKEVNQNNVIGEHSTLEVENENEAELPASVYGNSLTSSTPNPSDSMPIAENHPKIQFGNNRDIEEQSSILEQDKQSHKKALENLLDRLVEATDSANISFLEKTFFSVNNLIYRSRKNPDRSVLLAELDRFITKLAAER